MHACGNPWPRRVVPQELIKRHGIKQGLMQREADDRSIHDTSSVSATMQRIGGGPHRAAPNNQQPATFLCLYI